MGSIYKTFTKRFIYKLWFNIIYMEKECPYCKQKIIYKFGVQFSSHCANCKVRPNYYKKIENQRLSVLSKRKIYKFNCLKCKKLMVISLTNNAYNKGKYNKYCSHNCANSHIQTVEINQKRRNTLLNNIKIGKYIPHSGHKGNNSGNYKENGCWRVNIENKYKTFDKYNGICQICGKKLIQNKTLTWIAHHKNKSKTYEEYCDDINRILWCQKCHGSQHNKGFPAKSKLKRYKLFTFND